jgi:hypothetical protein
VCTNNNDDDDDDDDDSSNYDGDTVERRDQLTLRFSSWSVTLRFRTLNRLSLNAPHLLPAWFYSYGGKCDPFSLFFIINNTLTR